MDNRTPRLRQPMQTGPTLVKPLAPDLSLGIDTKTSPFLLQLPKIKDQRGNLTFIESFQHIPFEIKRIWFSVNSETEG